MKKKQRDPAGWSHTYVMTAGGVITLSGLAVMVGWYAHNVALVQVLPNMPLMRYNTALCFMLSGLALLALPQGWHRFARVLSMTVVALGLLTLSWQAITTCEQAQMVAMTPIAVVSPLIVYFAQTFQICAANKKLTDRRLSREITKRQEVESVLQQVKASLRESEERFQAFMNYSPIAAWITDADGRMLYYNKAYTRVFELLIDDENEKKVFDIFPAEFARTYLENIKMVVQTNQVVEAIELAPRTDGTIGDFLVYKFPIFNAFGQCLVGGVAIDNTDRQQAEEVLNQREQEFKALVENAPDIIARIDREMRHVYVNPAIELATGLSAEAFIGKSNRELGMPEPLVSDWESTIRLVFETGQETVSEFEFPTPSGLKYYQCRLVPEFAQDGSIQSLFSITRDISDRIQAEQQIKQLNEELELRVMQRTAQLEAANKELEAFSYSVSHDLRSPLQSIDGFSQAVLQLYAEQLNEKGKHYLQRIRANSQKMGQLMDAMLALSQVTRSEMYCDTVNLSVLVQAIASDIQETQRDRKIEFVIEEELVSRGDARLLRVLLENLLNNACKYTSKHPHARIEFGTVNEDWEMGERNSQSPIYFVRDDGAGFDMAYADKLFGAFQRLHRITEFPGTGIGLATCARIVRRHGGKIWAESVVEQGATFYFTLSDKLCSNLFFNSDGYD